MSHDRESLRPLAGADRPLRRRLSLRGELILALLPTLIVLLVLGLVEVVSRQRLLFASLAASAFLIYLDPEHGTNAVRTLVLAHLLAAVWGCGAYVVLGAGYAAGASAMVLTILSMIVLDVVHPPAVATALGFALRAGEISNVVLFAIALGVTAVLVMLEQVMLWLLAHYRTQSGETSPTASAHRP